MSTDMLRRLTNRRFIIIVIIIIIIINCLHNNPMCTVFK